MKIVNFKENNDNSINGFEINMDNKTLSEKLLKRMENQIALLEEKNKALAEENAILKSKK